MTILTNIANEVIILRTLICREVKSFNRNIKEIDTGIMDIDYSLVRYLCKILELKEVTINSSGYAVLRKEDNTVTTLGRFILEWYSKIDKKLQEILSNTEYEINHKNRDKLDNRIENLEIVTHQENIKHSKGLAYGVLMTTEYLQEIQKISLNSKQQEIDKSFLKRKESLFVKALLSDAIKDDIFQYCYLEFKNNKIKSNDNTSNGNDTNKNINYKEYKIMTIIHTNILKNLLQEKKQYLYKSIERNNINLLNRYIERYPYIKQVLKKYKLLDKEYNEELNFEKSNSRNLLLDFYADVYNSNQYLIEKDSILLSITLKYCFNTNGKYKSFLTLYLLGLLQRQNNISNPNKISNRYVHTPSFIRIPVYTEDLLKAVNERAKELLDLDLNRFTYFDIREEFGELIADSIYKNNKSKANYKYGLRAKQDIIQFLQTDKDIFTQGFMTKEDIFDHIQGLNTQRMIKEQEYNKVFDSFNNFISSLFLYNTDIKRALEELGLDYISLNKATIENIKKHQEKQGFKFSIDLKPRMKIIILKKLMK